MSISGTGPIVDRNGPLGVVSYGHNVFSSESEFPVIHHRMSVSMGWVLSLKNSFPSQHLLQSKPHKTEQPFLTGVQVA